MINTDAVIVVVLAGAAPTTTSQIDKGKANLEGPDTRSLTCQIEKAT